MFVSLFTHFFVCFFVFFFVSLILCSGSGWDILSVRLSVRGPWPEFPGLGSLPGVPGLGARGGGVRTEGHTYGRTKYPLYSKGHRPSGAAAQKLMISRFGVVWVRVRDIGGFRVTEEESYSAALAEVA